MHSFQPPLGSLSRLTARILSGWQHPALGDLRQTPDHRLHSTVGQDPVRAPTSQFVPPTSQTEAVNAQNPLLPDQPNRQMPTPKQAQLSEQEALGWPRARMGPARSWAEPSPFQMWWGHGPEHGPGYRPCGHGKRRHRPFVAQELWAALNPAARKRNGPAKWGTDSSKTPEIHEGPLLGPARAPSKVYLVLQSTQRNLCVPLFRATRSAPTPHGWAQPCGQPTQSVLEAPQCPDPELLGQRRVRGLVQPWWPSTHHQLLDRCSNNNLGSEWDCKFNFNNMGAPVEMSQKVTFWSVFTYSALNTSSSTHLTEDHTKG